MAVSIVSTMSQSMAIWVLGVEYGGDLGVSLGRDGVAMVIVQAMS